MNFGTLGTLLLGIWLIAAGALPLTGLGFPHDSTVMEILAIGAGVLLIVNSKSGGRRWWS
ncbi:MAG: hypothetical protein HY815_32175 [Candidatus Riflebacteria bacterium]|nr:hypothetical protein [Candidatus Riflebacteria bacterium]